MTTHELKYSPIVTVSKTFRDAFKKLGKGIPAAECESLSVFLNRVYGTRNRAFHGISHAIEVGAGCTPLGVLAALFHDTVYMQVDRSRFSELRTLFGVFDTMESLELVIPQQEVLDRDALRRMLTGVFGFKPGHKLGVFSGLNEFLSAWVVIQKLQKWLSKEELLQVVACIEMTIPFRGETTSPTVTQRLFNNLKEVTQSLKLNLSDEKLHEYVVEAVKISNNDVSGFGMEEPEVFIYNSWALLYESNPALQNSFYTISKYREPLQRLEAFLGSLSPRKIFYSYRNQPSPSQMHILENGAQNNLRTAQEYIKAKLLDTAILEAFATISGGDCPLELFTGPKALDRETKAARLEHFLDWKLIPKKVGKKNEKIVRLLNEGRAFRSNFDVKTSLFAGFIYLSLDEEEFAQAYGAANEFLKKQLSPENFLTSLPTWLVEHIASIVCQLAWTRADAINSFIEGNIQQVEAA